MLRGVSGCQVGEPCSEVSVVASGIHLCGTIGWSDASVKATAFNSMAGQMVPKGYLDDLNQTEEIID
jgi:hypothetical protein